MTQINKHLITSDTLNSVNILLSHKVKMLSCICLLAGGKAEVMEDLHPGQLDYHQGTSNHFGLTVHWLCSEGMGGIIILFVILAEPEKDGKYVDSIWVSYDL